MTDEEPKKRVTGRPKKLLPLSDQEKIVLMAECGMSLGAIARIMEMNRQTLVNNYSHLIQEGEDNFELALKVLARSRALEGDRTWGIYLMKSRFKWYDKPAEGAEDAPTAWEEAQKIIDENEDHQKKKAKIRRIK